MGFQAKNPEFWVLVSFVLFFVLFGGRLWKVVSGLLDSRAAAIRAELAEAQRLRQEAETMLAEAEAARAAALREAGEVLARSQAEATRLTEAAMAEAEASARRRERLALDRIAAAEKAALAEVRNTAVEVATQAAEQVIRDGMPTATTALIDKAIADLPAVLRAA